MPNTRWKNTDWKQESRWREDLTNLILIAGHAVYIGDDFAVQTPIPTGIFNLSRKVNHRFISSTLTHDRFIFKGVNDPIDLDGAKKGEKNALDAFAADPYGTKTDGPDDLGTKRIARNPFNRLDPYSTTCPQVAGLLAHLGPDKYNEVLPWT